MKHSQRIVCPKSTRQIALELARSRLVLPPDRIVEQVAHMGTIDSSSLTKGKSLVGKRNREIKVALVRPLGSLAREEEREAVKEMGEPYQLELLAKALLNAGYQVRIFDQLEGPYDPNEPSAYPATKSNAQFIADIEAFCPDVVGFGTFTYNFRKGLTIAAEVKKRTGAVIIFGGYHVTSVGKQYLLFDEIAAENPSLADAFKQDLRNVFQHGIVDYACIGEGVKTIIDILDILRGRKNPAEVIGIAYMENDRISVSEAERISLDKYPLPFRPDDFDPMKYYATGREYPFLLLSTANGCRFSCEYCSTGAMNYPGFRYRSAESVVKELKAVRERFYTQWPAPRIMVNLTDEDFGASPNRVIQLCNVLTEAGLSEVFEFNSFLDNMSILGHRGNEMLEAMKKAGFVFCFVGIESTLENALEGYARPDQWSDRMHRIQSAIRRMSGQDIMYLGDHIAGYPEHTIEDIEADYSRLFQLRGMHYAYFPILSPMPGTPLYWRTLVGELGEGFLSGITYDNLDANQQVVAIKGGGDVKAVRDKFVQAFFVRDSYEEDVDRAIETDLSKARFFANILGKISCDYPENETLLRLANKYASIT